ncbi:putative spore protein YtfJ [Mycetocola sp. BIGb0189]|uniref:spore germination protein GerW family protein n=1 Tax=Mycetocola sp. BIGb0189 TaxID=2940604 RepID=UPI002167BCE3|nr:spore germination protein GerW family protein [Mycetocola sp. BIGb0189]MCS4275819.1 putative spore protein YtfJ [Mycetocola sp. BIGb0189]
MTKIALDLADRFQKLGVQTSYGDPVTVEGATLIPVALTGFGFGAGEGEFAEGTEGEPAGSGGGGGGLSVPVGVYVRSGNGWRFEPNLLATIVVSVPLVWVAGRILTRLIKVLKK